jgi:hypothetical protein
VKGVYELHGLAMSGTSSLRTAISQAVLRELQAACTHVHCKQR